MKNVINCNQNNNPLINKKAKEVSVEEGLVIAEELLYLQILLLLQLHIVHPILLN